VTAQRGNDAIAVHGYRSSRRLTCMSRAGIPSARNDSVPFMTSLSYGNPAHRLCRARLKEALADAGRIARNRSRRPHEGCTICWRISIVKRNVLNE
jgi:hypothetical protein